MVSEHNLEIFERTKPGTISLPLNDDCLRGIQKLIIALFKNLFEKQLFFSFGPLKGGEQHGTVQFLSS